MTDVSGATKVADPTWNLVGYTAQYQQRVQLGATAVVVNALIDSSQDAPEFREQDVVETKAKAVHKQQAARATRKAKQVGDPAKGVAIEDAKVNQEEGDE